MLGKCQFIRLELVTALKTACYNTPHLPHPSHETLTLPLFFFFTSTSSNVRFFYLRL